MLYKTTIQHGNLMTDQQTKQDYFRIIHKYTESEEKISSSTQYYLKIFEKFGNKYFFIQWNWAAFFFGPYWMLYRRVYGLGIALLAFINIMMHLYEFKEVVFPESGRYYHGLFFVFGIMWVCYFGLFGNAIYFRSLRKRIAREESFGGTDGVIVILMLLITVLIGMLFDGVWGATKQ